MTPATPSNNGAAPADARPHQPWPVWRKVAAYVALAALAAAAVWYIDRRVDHRPPAAAPVTQPH